MSAINTFLQDFIANLPSSMSEETKQQILDLWNSSKVQDQLAEACKHLPTSKKVKVPKVPKRAKNAYVLYCQDHRSLAKSKLPKDHKPSDVMSKLGQMWKDLCSSSKEEDIRLVSKYTSQADAAKEIFMKEHNIEAQAPKKQRVSKEPKLPKEPKPPKEPKEPKRAKNAYVLYSQDHRSSVKSELGDSATNANVIRELGKRWKTLSASSEPQDQELVLKYTTQAALEKEKFAAKFMKPVTSHIVTPQYCYGCSTCGYGYCDKDGWFYCNQCWEWYNWSEECEETKPCAITDQHPHNATE